MCSPSLSHVLTQWGTHIQGELTGDADVFTDDTVFVRCYWARHIQGPRGIWGLELLECSQYHPMHASSHEPCAHPSEPCAHPSPLSHVLTPLSHVLTPLSHVLTAGRDAKPGAGVIYGVHLKGWSSRTFDAIIDSYENHRQSHQVVSRSRSPSTTCSHRGPRTSIPLHVLTSPEPCAHLLLSHVLTSP